MTQEPSKPKGKAPLCRCGCGKPVTWNKWRNRWNTYLKGHSTREPEARRKVSEAHTGRKHSAKSRRNMSIAHIGKYTGENHPMFGKHHTTEAKAKMSIAHIGKYTGENHPMFGKHHTTESRIKMSEALTGKKRSTEHRRNRSGQNNGHWNGGVTLTRTPSELTREYLQAIRRRDNFTCQFCGHKNDVRKRKLDVHHIDYNRKNNSHPDNLITLCTACHRDTEYNKAAWQRIYTNLIKRIKRQNPELHQAAVKLYEQNMRIFYKKG